MSFSFETRNYLTTPPCIHPRSHISFSHQCPFPHLQHFHFIHVLVSFGLSPFVTHTHTIDKEEERLCIVLESVQVQRTGKGVYEANGNKPGEVAGRVTQLGAFIADQS